MGSALCALAAACAGGPGVDTAKLITEDAATVGEGRWELLGFYSAGRAERTFDDGRDVVDRARLDDQAVWLEATSGRTDVLDLRAAVLWREVVRDESGEFADGLGNASILVKWCFFESADGSWSLAWLPGGTAPFGRVRREETKLILPGQEFWSFDNTLAATYASGPFNVSFDLSYLLPIGPEREDRRGIALANVGAGYQITPWLQPILEVGYTSGIVSGIVIETDTLAVTPGVLVRLSDAVRLDVGVIQTFFGKNEDVLTQALVGMAVSL
ncbi:MAG: transporter [Planctomycetota bacterium]